jgi:hypothetical protein
LEEVLTAIKGCRGLKSVIASRLSCHRHSVTNYLKRYPRAMEAYQDEVESMGDVAEEIILNAITQDDVDFPLKLDTAKWYCMKKLSHRGYGTPREQTFDPRAPVLMRVVYETTEVTNHYTVSPSSSISGKLGTNGTGTSALPPPPKVVEAAVVVPMMPENEDEDDDEDVDGDLT